MKTIIKQLEREIAKLQKAYDKKYKEYNKSRPDSDFGDPELYKQVEKISEDKRKLNDALALVKTVKQH